MFLKKIILNNYGLYRGEVVFNLSSDSSDHNHSKPIVLFGGQNGVGKTTLFDAIRLAFYGKNAVSLRLSENEYKAFLAGKIHRSPSAVLHSRSASITIEFDHAILGINSSYKICRSWEILNADKVSEKLSIIKDGTPVTGVNAEYWSGFIEEIIPERLSGLFFFDGEKIKKIADDTNGNAAMAESIRTLLGLDVVEKLQADISIYRTRQAKLQSSKEYAKEISELEIRKEKFKVHALQLKSDLASNQTAMDGLQNRIRSVETRLRNEGSVFALQRESLIEKRAQIVSALEEQSKIIRQQCETLFPFALCPILCSKLSNQLEAEEAGAKAQLLISELEEVFFDVKKLLPQNIPHSSIILENITERLERHKSILHCKPLLKLSSSETQTISSWIKKANNSAKKVVEDAINSRELFTKELRDIEQNIQKAPENSVLEPIIEELSIYNKKLGELQQQRLVLLEQQRDSESALADVQRRLEKVEMAQADDSACGNRIKLASDINKALNEYAKQLTKVKIKELRVAVTKCFNNLSSKGNLIEDIQINAETFAVTLFDRYGHKLPKQELSAGEKQMFAVALLWGLSITSGRPLPVIVDTPLGRLDSLHRKALIHNYFPKAANQVIILSTDTEIDEHWYSELKPYIANSFMLTHDKIENCTSVNKEYFWS